jgi:Protein of unknown function (DUF3300)
MSIRIQFLARQLTAVVSSFLLIPSMSPVAASGWIQDPAPAADEPAPKIPNDQLDSLVAPIALYPDPLLAQVLVASTYPLEIMQLQQWLTKNPGLKDKALSDAVIKENWDPSIQSMAALPDVVKRLSDDVKWTTDLGNAFLAQESDVMDAVQRMRVKAQGAGNLKSNEQMKVETQTVESKTVVVIEQTNPQVVYVPTYNPVVVYGPPVYPYPPIYYPPPGAYIAGAAISFGVGLAIGAAWGGGGWCCNSGWGHGNNNITINNNNNYVKNTNVNRNNVNGGNRNSGNSSWQHNPQHRGGTPYSNKATANQYGGARQNQGQAGGRQQPGANNRSAGGGANGAGANRPSAGGSAANTGANRGGASQGTSGGDRVGNRSVPSSSGGGSKGGALGGSGGASGGSARTSSSRGASSMGGSRGGGGGRRR